MDILYPVTVCCLKCFLPAAAVWLLIWLCYLERLLSACGRLFNSWSNTSIFTGCYSMIVYMLSWETVECQRQGFNELINCDKFRSWTKREPKQLLPWSHFRRKQMKNLRWNLRRRYSFHFNAMEQTVILHVKPHVNSWVLKEKEAEQELKKTQELAKAELAAAIAGEKAGQIEKMAEANLHVNYLHIAFRVLIHTLYSWKKWNICFMLSSMLFSLWMNLHYEIMKWPRSQKVKWPWCRVFL